MHNSDGLHKQVRDTASKRDTCARGFGCIMQMGKRAKATTVTSTFAGMRCGSWGYLQQRLNDKVNVTMQRTM